MSNPFEDPDRMYRALVNEEGQYSLWPDHLPVPHGWETVYGPAGRDECLGHVEREWADMRPASLIRSATSGPR
ncbi:MbtH family protein [Nonomuraea sp. NPDC051941]|uniref:MbtH family protein n=1 Tax=Nonomuraea sp. NPDC051941 TaxID=3364373 RepID=UPI0037C9FBD0